MFAVIETCRELLKFLERSECMAHFSGTNYMTQRHTVGRVEAFELRPQPLG